MKLCAQFTVQIMKNEVIIQNIPLIGNHVMEQEAIANNKETINNPSTVVWVFFSKSSDGITFSSSLTRDFNVL